MLSESERFRYQRQLIVTDWDQEKLKCSTVLVAGTGGLGGVIAQYLAAAGVGTLRLLDDDSVDLSNLNRQILFRTDAIGKPKSILACERLAALNPEIKIEALVERLTEGSASRIAAGCDVIVDGFDNQPGRFLLNSIASRMHIPYIYGAVDEWHGQASFFYPPATPCLACLVRETTPTTRKIPVFGAVPGVIGSLEAAMTIRYLMTGETPLAGQLLIFQSDTMSFDVLCFEKNPTCQVCGAKARAK